LADLSYDDVRKILATLDASTLDEVHIEIGDFKLDVRRRTAEAPMRPSLPDARTEPAAEAALVPGVRSPQPPGPQAELSSGQFFPLSVIHH